MKILVTGASGFIGSCFIRRALKTSEHTLVAFIRETDHRNMARLEECVTERYGRMRLVNGDLLGDLSGLCEGVDAVVNFAARTFVDHSILDPTPFIQANVVGTARLLEDARRNKVKRFIQISTDEVYGAILEGAYKEDSRLNPTNPYAASKAGADALVISYAHAFGMHTTITRTENNYGPYQHPQKVFPTFVKKALAGEKLPVYGDGKHRRQWLWVEDHVDAVLHLLEREYESGQVFHVAGNQELENLELAGRILDAVDKNRKVSVPWAFYERIKFIEDHDVRPGHDRRYALDCAKLRETGWIPKVGLDEGIEMAVNWYCDNQWWLA